MFDKFLDWIDPAILALIVIVAALGLIFFGVLLFAGLGEALFTLGATILFLTIIVVCR